MGKPIKLTAADMADVTPLDEPPKPAPAKLSQSDMKDISPIDAPEEPGLGERVWNGVKAVPGAVVETAKSFAKAVPTAVDLASPISKSGELQVPFHQLADKNYRQELERGVSNVVTGGLAEKAANWVDPSFKESAGKNPDAKNLGEVGGSFLPSPVNYAVGEGAKLAGKVGGKVGEAIGSTARSDRRLMNDVTDGARAKLRTKLEQAGQDETTGLIRSDAELLKSRKSPEKLLDVTERKLGQNYEKADGIYSNVATDSNDLVARLRARQEELRTKASGEELANAMEPHIKLLESRAERIAKKGPEMPAGPAPAGGTMSGMPAKPDMTDLERFSHEHPDGFDYLEPSGKVTATSEQATVAGKPGIQPPEPVPSKPPGDIDGRDLRQVITDHQEQAFNYLPGAKPTVANKAHEEVARVLRGALDGHVAAVNPEALKHLNQLNKESSILARMKAIAEYKKVNAPSFNTTRLTTNARNNRGAFAAGVAAVKYGFRSADEALAALARASKDGPVPPEMFAAAKSAGVKDQTMAMLQNKWNNTKPGRVAGRTVGTHALMTEKTNAQDDE